MQKSEQTEGKFDVVCRNTNVGRWLRAEVVGMRYARIIGDNVAYLLRNKNEKQFAETLGFSQSDVARIKEGRLILAPQDIKAIAGYFGVSREALCEKHSERCQVRIMGECSNGALDKVLDLIDVYCDVAEATAK